ncbi:hypothetical protein vseg_015447 [Gypsophila vaccaria]
MAAEPNISFHQEDILSSGLDRRAISFQSGAVNSTSEMLPMSSYYSMNSTGNLMFCDSSSIISSGSPTSTAAGNSLDSVPGLKHDAGLAVEWTEEEQYKLEEGLVKFKDEPSILKYVKIAAMLGDKTVRDVALRCRWMTRKRRKQEESTLLRKGNHRKNVAPYSFQQNHLDRNQHLKCQVLSSRAKQLLEQNLQAFNQIHTNMTCFKLQDNIDLFCHTRDNINNINAILNNMTEYSGKMSHMQYLPISIDQNLANSILPRTTP